MAKQQTQQIPPLPVSQTLDELRLELASRGLWVSTPHTTSRAHWLNEGEQRLDAGYYSDEGFAALRSVSDAGHDVTTVGAVAPNPAYPNRFKRIYARDKAAGIPFL